MSIFSKLVDGISEAIVDTAEVAGGLVIGTAVGVMKAPIVVANELVDEIEELTDD